MLCRQAGRRKNRIPDMINISERPPRLMTGQSGPLGRRPDPWQEQSLRDRHLVERTTGYTMLVHLLDGYKAEQVRDALAAKI